MAKKYVYSFGGGKADGKASMKNLLGGKGANLAEMAGHPDLRLPVPPGFTITTDVCVHYYANSKKYPAGLKEEVAKAMKKVEQITGKKFGDPKNPLLVSVRSGARKSMPGMMETVLNIGLTEKTIPGLAAKGGERFAYDAYRRLMTMYSDVVMEKSAGIEPKEGEGIRKQLEELLDELKEEKGYEFDKDLTADDLKKLCAVYKEKIKQVLGKPFPDNAEDQLWGGITAVFASWNGKRAISYRRIEGIPHEWGTAVNVQAMAFGNTGDTSATGVAFTRNPGNGDNRFYGEYLINAQGEDVVAGTRTPAPINKYSQSEYNKHLQTLEQFNPKVYKQLEEVRKRLEKHYCDMQDIEFTIEEGTLYMLQCRVGKRNGPAAVKMAMDMINEKLIKKEDAVQRVTPSQLDELLHPIIDPKEEKTATMLSNKGLPAGPGAASGQIVFTADEAVAWGKEGKKTILVREETNPEDVDGMRAAESILTARGGMTSHAALVARGWGKCCVVGCADIDIDYKSKEMRVDGKVLKEGDWITLNGTRGIVYEGRLPMIDAAEENKLFNDFLKICDQIKTLKVRTNADTPEDAAKARAFGAEGIGLFRTEHMFYGGHSEEPLFLLRKMIVSKDEEERRRVLNELFPHIKKDVKGTLKAMNGYPVTIRLLDPPLHEFVPHGKDQLNSLANSLGITIGELEKRASVLRESNPMMGHRGVRLGVTYPEITEAQVRAILEAAAELTKEGVKTFPEIMVPVVCTAKELESQKEIVDRVYAETLKKYNVKKIGYMFGTMIEIPRAALTADQIAGVAEFFSFGTNDLTQMGFGFSRDDIGGFLPDYVGRNILPEDPFQSLDTEGIGQLIDIGVSRGRSAKRDLKVGICGEHGGDPASISFCQKVGMDYVSCSPYRVPIARLAAAQAALAQGKAPKKKAAKKAVKKTAAKSAKRKAKKATKRRK